MVLLILFSRNERELPEMAWKCVFKDITSPTVCFTSSCSRNRAAVSLFWDLLCTQRVLCDPPVMSMISNTWFYKVIIFWVWPRFTQANTVRSIWFRLRNVAIVILIWDFWGPKGPLCDPKTGRKLLFGKKFTQMDLKWFRKDVSKKENIKLCQY